MVLKYALEVSGISPLLETREACLDMDDIKLNGNQFGALASWAFKEGCGNVKSSALVKWLNTGEDSNELPASELPHGSWQGGRCYLG